MISSDFLSVLHASIHSPQSSTELSGSFPRQLHRSVVRASTITALPALLSKASSRTGSCQQQSMAGQALCRAVREQGCRGTKSTAGGSAAMSETAR